MLPPLTGLSWTSSFMRSNRFFEASWVGSAVFILPKFLKDLFVSLFVCFQGTCVQFYRGQRLCHRSSASGWRKPQRVPDPRDDGGGPGEAAAQGRCTGVQRVHQEQIHVRMNPTRNHQSSRVRPQRLVSYKKVFLFLFILITQNHFR